ncbi:MAG: hypothetical protein JO115_18150 [Pseudonocardiales bacterium]|nr:hypothetical protein [Pseudonocardiales bacterium]
MNAPDGMPCAVSDLDRREFLEVLCVTMRLGASRVVPADAVALAQQATGLSDGQMRTRLMKLMVTFAELDRARRPS